MVTNRTVTLQEGQRGPVAGLGLVEDGRLARYFDLRHHPAAFIGRAERCHVQLEDEHVSEISAVWERRQGRAWLTPHDAAKNPVRVDGAAIAHPHELRVGCIIQVGASRLVVLAGPPESGSVLLQGRDLGEIAQAAVLAYGNETRAAAALDIARSTLRRWAAGQRKRHHAPPDGVNVGAIPEEVQRDP